MPSKLNVDGGAGVDWEGVGADAPASAVGGVGLDVRPGELGWVDWLCFLFPERFLRAALEPPRIFT